MDLSDFYAKIFAIEFVIERWVIKGKVTLFIISIIDVRLIEYF